MVCDCSAGLHQQRHMLQQQVAVIVVKNQGQLEEGAWWVGVQGQEWSRGGRWVKVSGHGFTSLPNAPTESRDCRAPRKARGKEHGGGVRRGEGGHTRMTSHGRWVVSSIRGWGMDKGRGRRAARRSKGKCIERYGVRNPQLSEQLKGMQISIVPPEEPDPWHWRYRGQERATNPTQTRPPPPHNCTIHPTLPT